MQPDMGKERCDGGGEGKAWIVKAGFPTTHCSSALTVSHLTFDHGVVLEFSFMTKI